MKFKIDASSPEEVNEKLMSALGGRELGKMLTFSMDGSQVVATIAKFGTSKIFFNQKQDGGTIHYEMVNEKIALAHRAFKEDVTKKMCQIIESIGGTFLD